MRLDCSSVTRSVLLVGLLSLPAVAQAQSVCPLNDPELFPFAGAMDVPLNGIVRVVYRTIWSLPEHEAADVVEVHECPEVDGAIECDPDFQRIVGSATLGTDPRGEATEAVWRAAGALSPGTMYLVRAADGELFIRGEYPHEGTFTTGDGFDEEPPSFGGARKAEIAEEEASDLVPDGYRVRVSFTAAEDASGSGNVEYAVYQTDGPGWTGPVERIRVRCLQEGTNVAAFVVPKDEIGRHACFQVRAADLFGRTDDNDREACAIPGGVGFFRSCAAAGGVHGGAQHGAILVVALALAVVHRRR